MFKIECDKDDLLVALKKVENTVGKESNALYSTAIKLEIVKVKGKNILKLITTNTNEVSWCYVELEGANNEQCTIIPSFSTLKGLVNSFEDGNIVIEEKDGKLYINSTNNSKNRRIKINGYKTEDFLLNSMPKFSKSIKINIEDLLLGINKATNIINESTKGFSIFNCINIKTSNTGIEFQALDNLFKRIMVIDVPGQYDDINFFIENSILKRVLSSFRQEGKIILRYCNNGIQFSQGCLKVFIRLHAGTFTDCSAAITSQYNTIAHTKKEVFKKALYRASILKCDKAKLTFKNKFINIKGESTQGDINENIPCDSNINNEITGTYKVDAFLKSILNIDTEIVSLCFNSKNMLTIENYDLKEYSFKCNLSQVAE